RRRRADPDVRPRWRDRQVANSIQLGGVADRVSLGVQVSKAATRPKAPDARLEVGNVPKTNAPSFLSGGLAGWGNGLGDSRFSDSSSITLSPFASNRSEQGRVA